MTTVNLSTEALLLLRAFGFLSLGEGEPVVGMNTLVSMCAALSAAAGPDARVVTDHGIELAPGLSWLVGGSHSPALHDQLVIGPLREVQNTLTANVHLAHQKMSAAQDRKKPISFATLDPNRKTPLFTPELLGLAKDGMLLDGIVQDDNGARNFTDVASRLLRRGALHSPAEFYTRGGFFHDGSDPRVLSDQLKFSHGGYPLVDFSLMTAQQAAAAGAVLLGIMDGRGMQSALPIHVRGIATVRTSGGVQAELLVDSAFAPWLNRMLWLTDRPLGAPPAVEKVVSISNPSKRYRVALETLLAARLGEKPVVIEQPGLLVCHRAFVRHLATLEPAIPGIIGALRNLIPTLFFGMWHLVQAGGYPKEFSWHLNGLTSLACFLADRMVDLYRATRDEKQNAFNRAIAASVLTKLTDGHQEFTTLRRRFDRLPAAVLREVLGELHGQGLVVREGTTWALAVQRPALNPPSADVP